MNIHSDYQTGHATKFIFSVIFILLTIGLNSVYGQTAKQFLQNTQTQSGAGGYVYDFSETVGVANSVISTPTSSASMVETLAFTMDISNLSSEITGDLYNVSLNVTAASSPSASSQFRLQRVNSSGTVMASTGYFFSLNPVGIKVATLNFGSVQVWAPTDRLRLSIEVQKTSGTGARTITVATGNANSWVNYLTPVNSSPSTYTTPGLSTFIAPPGLTSVTVECVGGGGAGAPTNANPSIGGGGGGGAYASSVVAVVPGNSYPVKVGKGKDLGPFDGDSYFNDISTVKAAGGLSPIVDVRTGAAGGSTALSVGTIIFAGGTGGTAILGVNSGGGGGGAGSTGAGGNGAAPTAGAGASLYGGPGGIGVIVSINGNNGSTYGGGGSGSSSPNATNRTGGFGANGIVVISWDAYYRTKSSGNWNSYLTWEVSYDNLNWYGAYCYPNSTAKNITVLNGHTVTVTNNVAVDEVLVEAGGQITVNSGITLAIVDGAGTDMTVNGTIFNSGTITTTGTLVFNAATTYQHAQNGGNIPTATWNVSSTCLVTGITNAISLTGLGQVFGNFTWNCTGQTSNLYLASNISITGNLSVLGTGTVDLANHGLLLSNTATGYTVAVTGNVLIDTNATFKLNNSTGSCTMNLGGNFTLNSGNFTVVTGAANSTVNVTGNVIVSVGSLNMQEDAGANVGTLNVKGNFTISGGTITETGGGTGSINFNGTTIQTYSKTGGAISQSVNFAVISGSVLDVGISIIDGSTGTFTLNAGAGIITANAGGLSTGASGSIRTTARIYNTGANYTYNGIVAQVTGNGLTGANNLTINNVAGVTLTNAVSVSGSLMLTNGIVTSALNFLSVTNGLPSAITGGSAAAYINGSLKWTLPTNLTAGSGFYYNFPVGTASAYLPFALTNPTTSAGTVTAQVQAFSANAGGGLGTLTSKSITEYWSLTTANFTNGSVSLTRPTTITPFNVVAGCSTKTGTYASLGGAYDTYGVSGSELIGANRFFILAESNIATLGVSTNSLTGFNYLVGYGPSNELSFHVGGFSLTGDIIITPPTNFEISRLSGGVFQSTPLTLTQVVNRVNATIYVRLKKDLSVGNYGPENITVASSGFTAKTVACSGYVVPGIMVGGGGSYCSTQSIILTSNGVDYNNIYWEGPNNFYLANSATATIPSPLTAANAGTYTLTATFLDPAGINLVNNGGFETGNDTGNDLTQYNYVLTTPTALSTGGTNGNTGGEGNFAVCNLPNNVHTGFSSNPAHEGSYQMVINGSSVATDIVWGQTIPVIQPNTSYQFSYWEQSAVAGTPSKLKLYANGSPAISVNTAPLVINSWQQYIYTWNSGASTSVALTLKDAENLGGGNDFALDNIIFQKAFASSASVDVTVITGALPSVRIDASANPVNSGTNVTFTATPTNGGTAPSYQWKVNGTNVGTDSPSYIYIPTHGDIVSCVMTSNSGCLNGAVNPFTSSVIMTVNTVYNYWLGTNSTNWGTASNWTAGYVPASGDNIIFSTVSTSGNALNDLVLDVDRTIGSLTNATTAPVRRIIIPPAKGLTVNDSIISPDNDPERVYIQAYPDGTQQNGTLIFHNKTTSVYGTVEMYSKANITALLPPDKYNWQYFGIPVHSIQAEPTFYGSYVRRWEETGDAISTHWIELINASVLQKFLGYEICHPVAKVIIFQGQLVNSDFNSGKLAITATARFPGQHILANPYTAAINIKNIVFGADAESTVYLYNTGTFGAWTSALGGFGTNAGQYISIPQALAGQPLIPLEIPSMQAMLIRPNPLSVTFDNYNISINYADVVMKNHDLQLAPSVPVNSTSDIIVTMIDVKSKNHSDRVWLFSDPACTRGFDNGWDGQKMSGTALAPQLFAQETDGNYQIDAVADMNDTYLYFQAGQDLEDTLVFTHRNTGKQYAAVYLVDLVENKMTDITVSGTQYAFVAESTPAPVKRFKIVTLPVEKGDPDAQSQIKIFSSQETIFVQNFSNLDGECVIYDIAGLYIKKVPFGPGVTAVYNGLIPGAYIATATAGSEKVSKRLIVR